MKHNAGQCGKISDAWSLYRGCQTFRLTLKHKIPAHHVHHTNFKRATKDGGYSKAWRRIRKEQAGLLHESTVHFAHTLATNTISSSDGVIRPESPTMSTFSSIAFARIWSQGCITPMSYTLKEPREDKREREKDRKRPLCAWSTLGRQELQTLRRALLCPRRQRQRHPVAIFSRDLSA